MSSRNSKLRWLLVGLGGLAAASTIGYAVLTATQANRSLISTLPFDSRIQAAFDLRKDTSRGLFEVTAVVTGALWGLVLAKGSFSSWGTQERILFGLANAGLLFSMLCHILYSADLARFLTDAVVLRRDELVIPDVFEGRLGFKFNWQVASFFCGSIITGFTFLGGKLKS